MKKLLPLFAGVLFAGAISAQSIPNGGFEYWNTNTYNDPQYFSTSNDQNFSKGIDTANVTEAAGYLGVNYGVQLQTINTSNGIQAGYMLDGIAGKSEGGLSGGIAYTQKPTGVRFYYKWAPATNDTALFIVAFTTNGVQTLFEDTIITAESSYTLYQDTFSLPTTPDTVLFAAISSKAGIQGGGGHVGSILTIDSITFTGVSSQPANMNADFQNWTSDTVYTLPGWYFSYPNVFRTTDADSGKYALEVTTANTAQNGVQQGQASTGYYPNNCDSNCYEHGGRAYTLPVSGKDTLRFAYEYSPISGDTANINLNFIDKGQSVHQTGISLWGTNTSYKDTSLAFGYDTSSTHIDTVIITITSSWHINDTANSQYGSYVGSVLKVDNITFTSQNKSLGVNNISATEGIKVYPNPANSQVNIDLTSVSGSLQKINLYDMSGRMLSSQNYSGGMRNTIQTIDISNLASGIYLVEVTTSNGKFYQKIAKE